LGKSARPELGDYSLACFRLAKEHNKPPQQTRLNGSVGQVAEEIASLIKPTDLIEKVQAVGGYVNIFLNATKLAEFVLSARGETSPEGGKEDNRIPNIGNGKTIVIDYSSPNIAKPFGIGHLRSTVIGNALYKIYSALGYKCVGINFLGDWGTQFGHIIDGIEKDRGHKLKPGDITTISGNIQIGIISINDLNNYYTLSTSADDPVGRENARKIFQGLENKDPNISEFWRASKERSIKEFQRIYDLLNVTFDEYSGEADTNQYINQTIADIEKKGLAEISEGALVVKLDKYNMPPCLLRKQDGATLYATRDIAAAIHRYNTYKFHKLIYVVGSDQKLHFRQVFKVLELMDYPWAKDCFHIDFGLVRFKDDSGYKQKMSTRRGTTILLEDVLNQAIERSEKIMQERSPELASKVSPADMKEIAQSVGIGAIIFNDLKNKRIKDVDFDWSQILSFDGETGPYLQYTHTRLNSLIGKYGKPIEPNPDYKLLNTPEDTALVKSLSEFVDVIQQSAEQYEPSILSNYLLNLASLFNRYYQYHRIISEDKGLSDARIYLVNRLKDVFSQGLTLLGITPLEKM
jgi:arginyl-tRNA synthetase